MKQAVSGAILAGGESRRFGQDKARAVLGGQELIARVLATLQKICEEVFIITNPVRRFGHLDVTVVSDLIKGAGSLGGLLTALVHARYERSFVVGCDMPLLNARLIRQMCEQPGDFDVVVPVWRGELQPLHAIYSKRCVPWIEKRLLQRDLKIVDFFPRVSILRIEEDLWKDLDPDGLSFMNINTQAELRQAQLRWDRLALERHEQAVPEVVS
jgi:molybdopterin-guanine dinucleotide biosynthesis protein A